MRIGPLTTPGARHGNRIAHLCQHHQRLSIGLHWGGFGRRPRSQRCPSQCKWCVPQGSANGWRRLFFLSPLTRALSLSPLPPQAGMPIGLPRPRSLDLPVLPVPTPHRCSAQPDVIRVCTDCDRLKGFSGHARTMPLVRAKGDVLFVKFWKFSVALAGGVVGWGGGDPNPNPQL